MCGRYTLSTPADQIADLLEATTALELEPRYNIAPTQEAPIVRVAAASGARELVLARWGLVPWWSEDSSIGSRLINARSETAQSKRAFRDAFERRRCLVPADGFYEWARVGGGARQPYLFRPASGSVFVFAGLWERWLPPGEAPLDSFTILTAVANERVAPVHDRMPVILSAEGRRRWLAPAPAKGALLELLEERPPADHLIAHPVSSFVNSPANDSPRCVEPIEEPPVDPAPMLW